MDTHAPKIRLHMWAISEFPTSATRIEFQRKLNWNVLKDEKWQTRKELQELDLYYCVVTIHSNVTVTYLKDCSKVFRDIASKATPYLTKIDMREKDMNLWEVVMNGPVRIVFLGRYSAYSQLAVRSVKFQLHESFIRSTTAFRSAQSVFVCLFVMKPRKHWQFGRNRTLVVHLLYTWISLCSLHRLHRYMTSKL